MLLTQLRCNGNTSKSGTIAAIVVLANIRSQKVSCCSTPRIETAT